MDFSHEATVESPSRTRPLRCYPARLAQPAPPTPLTPSQAVHLGFTGPFGGTDDAAVTVQATQPAPVLEHPRPVPPLPAPPAPAPPAPAAEPRLAADGERRPRWWWQRMAARLRSRPAS